MLVIVLNCRSPNHFFVQRAIESPQELDNEYYHVLEQMFQLKHHGHLNLFEQDLLTAEDRKWWIDRIKKQYEDEEKQSKSSSNVSMPHLPNMPNMPQRRSENTNEFSRS